MLNYTMFAIIASIILLIILAGLIALQIKLSKNKRIGLILPIVSFVVVTLITIIIFTLKINDIGASAVTFDLIWKLIVSLLLCNIPSYIFIMIYVCTQKNIQKKKDLEKINIQNL